MTEGSGRISSWLAMEARSKTCLGLRMVFHNNIQHQHLCVSMYCMSINVYNMYVQYSRLEQYAWCALPYPTARGMTSISFAPPLTKAFDARTITSQSCQDRLHRRGGQRERSSPHWNLPSCWLRQSAASQSSIVEVCRHGWMDCEYSLFYNILYGFVFNIY